MFKISVDIDVKHNEAVVRLTGKEIDIDNSLAENLSKQLYKLADAEVYRIRLDCTNVYSMSSLALGKLVVLSCRLKENSGHLRLTNVSKYIKRILQTTKLSDALMSRKEQNRRVEDEECE